MTQISKCSCPHRQAVTVAIPNCPPCHGFCPFPVQFPLEGRIGGRVGGWRVGAGGGGTQWGVVFHFEAFPELIGWDHFSFKGSFLECWQSGQSVRKAITRTGPLSPHQISPPPQSPREAAHATRGPQLPIQRVYVALSRVGGGRAQNSKCLLSQFWRLGVQNRGILHSL